MWEYLIGYVAAQGDAPCVVEEREWPNWAAMEAQLNAEGWELLEEAAHRAEMRRVVFRRAIANSASLPRHLIPCW